MKRKGIRMDIVKNSGWITKYVAKIFMPAKTVVTHYEYLSVGGASKVWVPTCKTVTKNYKEIKNDK
jgi:hypothetical protein